jgi:UDP-N-acetylmuramoyl-tripeptide--D-alanyl-D-alanine ligase
VIVSASACTSGNPLRRKSATSFSLPGLASNLTSNATFLFIILILDAYNANPASMKAALENFRRINSKNKIAILGDMMELGDYACEEHKNILQLASSCNLNQIITVGPEFAKVKIKDIIQFQDLNEAKEWLTNQHFKNAYILLKGSRKIGLEKIVSDI